MLLCIYYYKYVCALKKKFKGKDSAEKFKKHLVCLVRHNVSQLEARLKFIFNRCKRKKSTLY